MSWRAIHYVVVSAWIAFFISCWALLFATWGNHKYMGQNMWLYGIVVFAPLLCTLVSGTAALLHRQTRQHLFTLPTAAALSAVSLAFIIVAVGLLFVSVAMYGAGAFTALPLVGGKLTASALEQTGYLTLPALAFHLAIGMFAFPATVGLVFPLGIPLACALIVWGKTSKSDHISSRAWITAVVISALGWLMVVCVGMLLGAA